VHRERLVVAGNRDWTARSRVTGLAPGEEYTYRFVTRDGASPAGRFRTAYPAGSSERLRIAFFSCQEFVAGYYHAHADLTKQDVDLVVCLGDYVYEKAYGGSIRSDTTAPDGETQTLAEYRAKYSLYHTDPQLLEVRRKFPLVAIWDDHEVEDNYAGDLPGGAAENRSTSGAPTATARSSSTCHAGCVAISAPTAGSRSATPSCSCSTRASSGTTSRAVRPTPPSPRRAPRRSPTTRTGRCSAMYRCAG
jgi:alkaline phosphatase D